MKKVILTTVILLFSFLTFSQEYPFSITKIGKGNQALIFIPGFASSGDVWNETIDSLKNDYTCYVLTMSGFAGAPPKDNSSFEYWKTEIAKFISENKINKPIVIGHSMGGGLAMAIAADYPDLLNKIVVVDALPCLLALTNPEFKSVADNDCSNLVDQIMKMPEDQFIQMQKMSVASLSANQSKHDEILSWSLKSDRKTFAQMFCDFSNTDLRQRIKNVQIPSLILLEAPFKTIEDSINEQYKEMPSAQLKYANKGLHFIMFDDQEWYIKELVDFLKE